MSVAIAIDLTDIRQLEQFIYREARFADEHDFDSWEALWTDDALYWVPIDGTENHPMTHMSIIYDNRRRISTRLQQLRTGKRYAQSPPSNLRRIISNVELLESIDDDAVVGANFIVFESKERGTNTWAGRVTYRLRAVEGEIKLVGKTVVLVNNAETIPTMGFLI
jgi:benzoate/toluate 1,2-dioxygenase beta subunit